MNNEIVIWVRPVTYVGQDFPDGPTPEDAGLNPDTSYRVLDIISDTDQNREAFLCLINDEDQLWFVSNRHFRVIDVTDSSDIPIYTKKPI